MFSKLLVDLEIKLLVWKSEVFLLEMRNLLFNKLKMKKYMSLSIFWNMKFKILYIMFIVYLWNYYFYREKCDFIFKIEGIIKDLYKYLLEK